MIFPPTSLHHLFVVLVHDFTVFLMLLAVASSSATVSTILSTVLPFVRMIQLLVVFKVLGNATERQLMLVPLVIVVVHIVVVQVLTTMLLLPPPAAAVLNAVATAVTLKPGVLVYFVCIVVEIDLRLFGIIVFVQTVRRAICDLHRCAIVRHDFALFIFQHLLTALADITAVHGLLVQIARHLILVVHIAVAAVRTTTVVASASSARILLTIATARVPAIHPRRPIVVRCRCPSARRRSLSIGSLLIVVRIAVARHHRATHHIRPAFGAHTFVRARLRHVHHTLLALATTTRSWTDLSHLCVHHARLADAIVALALAPIVTACARRRRAAVALTQDVAARGEAVRRAAQTEIAAGRVGEVRVHVDVVHIVGGHIGRDVDVIGGVEDVGQPDDGGDVAAGLDACLV